MHKKFPVQDNAAFSVQKMSNGNSKITNDIHFDTTLFCNEYKINYLISYGTNNCTPLSIVC